jgi:hypothetical protein
VCHQGGRLGKFEQLTELADFYGFDLRDISNNLGYKDRKRATYGLYDRRDNTLACSYSTFTQIKNYLRRFQSAKSN